MWWLAGRTVGSYFFFSFGFSLRVLQVWMRSRSFSLTMGPSIILMVAILRNA